MSLLAYILASIPPPPGNGFGIGPLFFHFYGLCIALGILAAFWLGSRRWRQAGGNPADLEVPGIAAVVAGFLGARLAYVSTHLGDYEGRWLHILAIWEGGLALYGGLTLGLLTGIWVARRRGLPVLRVLDAAVPGIPLAQALGRWGNYFNQELFGTPTTLPWALEVEEPYRPERYAQYSTFHPTFLYESLWNLAVVGLLLQISRLGRLRTGSLTLCYLALYGTGRFFLELIRTDTTFRFLGLSRNAWVSVAVVLGSVTWLLLRERRRPGEPAAGASAREGEPPAGTGGDGGVEESSGPARAAGDGATAASPPGQAGGS